MKSYKLEITNPGNTVVVENTVNGYILYTFSEDAEEAPYVVKAVFEDTTDYRPTGETGYRDYLDYSPETTKKMLWSLLEALGIFYSKHNKSNIVITIEDIKKNSD